MAGQPATRYCKPAAAANDFKQKAERGGASANGTNLLNTSLKSIKLLAIVCGGHIAFFRARLFIWLNAKPGDPLLASKPASTRPKANGPTRITQKNRAGVATGRHSVRDYHVVKINPTDAIHAVRS
jgi:hypothetical protein